MSTATQTARAKPNSGNIVLIRNTTVDYSLRADCISCAGSDENSTKFDLIVNGDLLASNVDVRNLTVRRNIVVKGLLRATGSVKSTEGNISAFLFDTDTAKISAPLGKIINRGPR